MTRILIVEDEPAMLAGLCDNLEFEGYQVASAERGDKALGMITSESYDLILLDVMLPQLSGFDILKQMRAKAIATPVILLTAKGEELDKVRGLELGADDYITKPFSLRELLARIKAILRRTSSGKGNTHEAVEIGRLSVDFAAMEASEAGQPVKLSHKEFEILLFLYQHANQIVTREKLLDSIWGYDYQPTSRTIDNFILRLRQKVDTAQSNHIVTVHGFGYKLVL
ncbi:response regulator transcription factor [Roseimarinus sediminis]|jgi:DNA-binding response OmpR family regulator|uniref:response regulator transcription factor n=1 Tax=Roseimarinus sediminis TaxID=1610899 RepID=UPI003D1C67CA